MRFSILLLIAWTQFSCQSKDSKDPTVDKTVSVNETLNKNATGNSNPTLSSKTDSSSETVYHGTIKAAAGNDQPVPAGKIELSLSDSNFVSGTISLQEKSLPFNGINDRGVIRAWLGSTIQNDESPLLGYLVGTHSADRAQGNFALSGNAGVPNIHGTWEARPK